MGVRGDLLLAVRDLRLPGNGRDITGPPISDRDRLGLTLAWQEPARFEDLPVGAYLALGGADGAGATAALEAVAPAPAAYLGRSVDRSLSGGERQRAELGSVFTMHRAAEYEAILAARRQYARPGGRCAAILVVSANRVLAANGAPGIRFQARTITSTEGSSSRPRTRRRRSTPVCHRSDR